MTKEMLENRIQELKNNLDKITQEYALSSGRLNEAVFLYNSWVALEAKKNQESVEQTE